MTEATFSFDLHVLGTPPAFVLSQDQTLQLILRNYFLELNVDREIHYYFVGPYLRSAI